MTLFSCNNYGEKSVSQNDEFEHSPKTDKDLIEKHEQQQNDSLTTDNTYEEYLGERLKPIRENFKRINEIKEWTSVDKRRLNQSSEGGAATYYFLKDTLLKVIAINFGETGKTIQKFYTKDGQLLFVLEKKYKYNRPITWDSLAMKANNDTEVFDIDKSEIIEYGNYFENGIVIRKINNHDCGYPFSEEYLKDEETRLKAEFKKLKQQLKQ